MDMKLDFVPPSLINFLSRQLIGNGFRLYQKAVASVSNYNENYSKILEDPMYTRIRKALYSIDKQNENMDGKEFKPDACLLPQEHSSEDMKKNFGDMEQNIHQDKHASEPLSDNARVMDKNYFGEIEEEKTKETRNLKDAIRGLEQKVHCNDRGSGILQNSALATDRKAFSEIEEEESEDRGCLEKSDKGIGQPSTSKIAQKSLDHYKRNILVSPEVEQALETLEKAISMVREYGFNVFSSLSSEETSNQEKDAENDSIFVEEGGGGCSNTETSVEVPGKGRIMEKPSHESRNNSSNCDIRLAGSNSYSKEVNHNRIAPASPEQHLSDPSESNQIVPVSSKNGTIGVAEVPMMDQTMQDNQHENDFLREKKLSPRKKHKFCCFGPSFRGI